MRWGRSFSKSLAAQLLLRLNPKRRAAAPIHCPPKGSCGPRLRFCASGGEEPPPKRGKHYGFAGCSYKHHLELHLRYP